MEAFDTLKLRVFYSQTRTNTFARYCLLTSGGVTMRLKLKSRVIGSIATLKLILDMQRYAQQVFFII